MRKIKFRAWNKHKKEMMVISSIFLENEEIAVKDFGMYHYFRMKDIELMQYTGLKDANGVEIYENDILFSVNENGIFILLIGFGESERDYDEFLMGFKIIKSKMINCDQDFSSLDDKIKEIIINNKIPYENSEFDDFLYDGWWIIGNKYENKELLEVK